MQRFLIASYLTASALADPGLVGGNVLVGPGGLSPSLARGALSPPGSLPRATGSPTGRPLSVPWETILPPTTVSASSIPDLQAPSSELTDSTSVLPTPLPSPSES